MYFVLYIRTNLCYLKEIITAIRKVRHALHEVAGKLHKHESTAQKKENAQVEGEHTPPPPTHVLHIPDTVINRIKSKTAEEQRRERFRDWVQELTLAIILFYSVVAFFQWKELNVQNINQSSAIINTGVTADRTLRQGHQALETQQRAWLGAYVVLVQRTYGEILDVVDYRLVLKNTGPTPALGVKVEPGYMFKERDYLLESDFAPGNTIFLNPEQVSKTSRFAVLPNDVSYGPTYGFNLHHPPRKSLVPGTYRPTSLFLTGQTTYNDIFGHTHTTEFCVRLQGKTLIQCNLHNNMN